MAEAPNWNDYITALKKLAGNVAGSPTDKQKELISAYAKFAESKRDKPAEQLTFRKWTESNEGKEKITPIAPSADDVNAVETALNGDAAIKKVQDYLGKAGEQTKSWVEKNILPLALGLVPFLGTIAGILDLGMLGSLTLGVGTFLVAGAAFGDPESAGKQVWNWVKGKMGWGGKDGPEVSNGGVAPEAKAKIIDESRNALVQDLTKAATEATVGKNDEHKLDHPPQVKILITDPAKKEVVAIYAALDDQGKPTTKTFKGTFDTSGVIMLTHSVKQVKDGKKPAEDVALKENVTLDSVNIKVEFDSTTQQYKPVTSVDAVFKNLFEPAIQQLGSKGEQERWIRGNNFPEKGDLDIPASVKPDIRRDAPAL